MNGRRLGPAATAIAAAIVLATAGAAQGSAVRITNGTCFVAGSSVLVDGSGFTASAPVTLQGEVAGSAAAGPLGTFADLALKAPEAGAGVAPRTVAFSAVDGANPANASAPVAFKVVREALDGNYARAINGSPSERTTWRFAGFETGRGIFGHFRHAGRTRRTVRFGVARGDCGTLTVRRRRIPLRALQRGRWMLQVDQQPSWSPATEPRRVIPIEISRSVRAPVPAPPAVPAR